MGTLARALESVGEALDRDDAAAALAGIVAAWRTQHHSRIGALAGRISTLAGAGRPAIAAKTVKARLAAWLEAEKSHDLVDVERLLADPWPTQWRDGSDRFERIVKWERDPRVAAHLTRFFVDPPYDSEASAWLRLNCLEHLVALEDPRSIDAVKTAVEALAETWNRAISLRDGLAAWLEKLAAMEELAPDVEERVAALEQRFAAAVKSEASSKKTAAELLEAIWAAPDDITPKAVFSDWLTERGDPRGELIALQLGAGDAARERALIAKISEDHAAFDWPVVEQFRRGFRRYEHGFFVGGHPRSKEPLALGHPAWSHVRVLTLRTSEPWFEPTDFDYLGKLTRLRELTNIAAHSFLPLLAADAPDLELLEIVDLPYGGVGRPPLDAKHPIATTTKLPKLKALGIAWPHGMDKSHSKTIPSWPIVQRIERLLLRQTSAGPLQELIANLVGPKIVEVRPSPYSENLDEAEIMYRLERDGPTGPFRRIAIRGPVDLIIGYLEEFPEKSFDHVSIDRKRGTLKVADRERLLAVLARFPGATIEPPIGATTGNAEATPPRPKAEVVAQVTVCTSGANFNDPKRIGRAMAYAAKLGVTFDSYVLGYGDKLRPLKPDPVKKAEAVAKPDRHIALSLDGTANELKLRAGGESDRFVLEIGRTALEGLLDWTIALASDPAAHVDTLSLAVEPRPLEGARATFSNADRETINPLRLWPDSNAVAIVLDERWSKHLTPALWKKHLAGEPALAGLFLRDAGTRRLVGMHADLLAPPTLEEHQAFARVVYAMAADAWEKEYGYRWQELIASALAPAMKELGLNNTTTTEMQRLRVSHGDHRRLVVTITEPFEAPALTAALEVDAGLGWHHHDLGDGKIATKEEAMQLLDAIAARALEDRAWLATPQKKLPRRRARAS